LTKQFIYQTGEKGKLFTIDEHPGGPYKVSVFQGLQDNRDTPQKGPTFCSGSLAQGFVVSDTAILFIPEVFILIEPKLILFMGLYQLFL
jgi:hypothetical protein